MAMDRIILLLRRIAGYVTRLLTPESGFCRRCGIAWTHVMPHHTRLADNHSCFCLCEYCWGQLTLEGRIPYYRALWMDWKAWGEKSITWHRMEEAVMAEEG